MNRRNFLKKTSLAGLITVAPRTTLAASAAGNQKILLQITAIAGFQYYDGEQTWKQIPAGALLTF